MRDMEARRLALKFFMSSPLPADEALDAALKRYPTAYPDGLTREQRDYFAARRTQGTD